ncbi:MAG TPA: cytochrome d ubiquinol oxidase subunit II [Bryobacteraceae bacterium]|nr:cytochrome d ubiquinol oxidase subunit II [Bryobacteraceae bacterium]
METLWFVLVVLMLVGYVLLDGFDLGAGAVSVFVARDDESRRKILQSIGPVWDGNEVWLLAAGGTLFYAFPLLYASGFSGFYLPLNIVLWLLIFRAMGIEFRAQVSATVWRDFFDGAFSIASTLLIVFFGAALGNVMRGVPLGADRYFFLPLWTDFRPGAQPGILDWYTILCGVATLAATAMHGALYLVVKTEGALNERLRGAVRRLWPAVLVLSAGALAASIAVRPSLLDNYRQNPAGWLLPALVAGALAGVAAFTRARRERAAFLSSCVYIVATLGGAALALYPTLLPSSGDPANAITIGNAAAGKESLAAGLVWWISGMAIALGYFVLVYRMFKGKVRDQPAGHGY